MVAPCSCHSSFIERASRAFARFTLTVSPPHRLPSHSLRHVDAPTFYPIGDAPSKAPEGEPLNLESLLPASTDIRTGRGFSFLSVLDFARAFRSGAVTPDEVARKILDQVKATKLNAVIKWNEAVSNASMCLLCLYAC